MRNFVGAFDCIDKPNMPCGGHLNCKNNDLPSFSASQEPISSTRWKTSKTKRNFLIYNRFTGNHPRIFGNSNEGSYLHKKNGISHAKWRYLPSFCRLFTSGCSKILPQNPLKIPPKRPPADIIKGREFDFDSIDRDSSKPRLEFYRSFCSKIILHHKT